MRFRMAALLCISALIACAPPQTDVAAVRTEIGATWTAFTTAWLAGKPSAAVAAFFTEDAINTVPSVPAAIGRQTIDSSLSAFQAGFKVTGLKQSTDEVVAVGDLAYERGRFEQTMQMGNAPATVQQSRYLAIWRKQPDGHWRCSRFLFNDAAPPPAPTSPARSAR